MIKPSWRLLLVGVVLASVLAIGVSQADAFGGCHRGGCGWSSCYSPAYTVGCWDSCWYGGCYVPAWPCVAYRASYGCCGWYGYGWSSCGWDACGYDACCGTVTGSAASPTQAQPTPAQKPAIEPAPAAPPAAVPGALPSAVPGGLPPEPPTTVPGLKSEPSLPGSSTDANRSNAGLLTIYVPYEAKVTVNGRATQSTGSRRQYVSYGLKPGFSYKYEVRAEVIRDGVPTVDTRTVTLTAGSHESVAFGFNPKPDQELAINP